MTAPAPMTRRLLTTPLRDVLRGRITGRLDWRRAIAAAELPPATKDLIVRVVRRSRLWRSEKADVTNELIAHFTDGLANGANADALQNDFGDPAATARLIRRAKLRSRPWTWKARRWMWRGAAALVVVYAGAAVMFYTGRPTPTIDYVAELNRPVLAVPDADRAWPLYVQAHTALGLNHKGHDAAAAETKAMGAFQDALGEPLDGPRGAAITGWIAAHQPGIELLRRAAARPALGFVFGPDGSARDVMNGPSATRSKYGTLIEVLLPYLNDARFFANNLAGDAQVAAADHDSVRFVADLHAQLRIADHTSRAAPFVVSGLIGIGIRGAAVDRIASTLRMTPDALDDASLVALAHLLAGPQIAGDLVDISGERSSMRDLIQHAFTDDGHGDGHLTARGVAMLRDFGVSSESLIVDAPRGRWPELIVSPTVMLMQASRRATQAAADRYFDAAAARLARPLRDADNSAERELAAIFERSWRYGVIARMLPSMNRVGESGERYLGERDGVVVALALELHRRHHGTYPATLDELVPALLPAVPVDRITGDAARYRLIGGKPVIYSVGVDRDDDGGRRVKTSRNTGPRDAARWQRERDTSPAFDGDWVLYSAAVEPGE